MSTLLLHISESTDWLSGGGNSWVAVLLDSLFNIQKFNKSALELPPFVARQGWGLACFICSTAGVFLCGPTSDCAVKCSLLTSMSSEHLPYPCPQEGPLGTTICSLHVEHHHREVSFSCIFLSRGARDVALVDQSSLCLERDIPYWPLEADIVHPSFLTCDSES